LLRSGADGMSRGFGWGFVLVLPVAGYLFFTLPYGAGLVALPMVLVGPLVGAWIAFHLAAAAGMFRAGYRWKVLLVPALAAIWILVPYVIYGR
jgi:hypothetical protein